jgi:hypothetical protein
MKCQSRVSFLASNKLNYSPSGAFRRNDLSLDGNPGVQGRVPSARRRVHPAGCGSPLRFSPVARLSCWTLSCDASLPSLAIIGPRWRIFAPFCTQKPVRFSSFSVRFCALQSLTSFVFNKSLSSFPRFLTSFLQIPFFPEGWRLGRVAPTSRRLGSGCRRLSPRSSQERVADMPQGGTSAPPVGK